MFYGVIGVFVVFILYCMVVILGVTRACVRGRNSPTRWGGGGCFCA